MKKHKYIYIFLVISIISALLYVFLWMLTTRYDLFPSDPVRRAQMARAIRNITQRKTIQLIAMIVSAVLIASTSLVFQTLTHNRILTPSLIGFDSIFITVQTLIIFLFTSKSLFYTNIYINFFISAGLMIFISMLMYALILRKNRNNLIFLLLVGMILSTLSRSLANFLQTIMNPDEFQSIVIRTEVSVSNMNTGIIIIAIPILIVILGLIFNEIKALDVMTLGEAQATGLGVSYQQKMNLHLIYIAVAMSVATAMIGPISFLGLIAVNASRELLKTYRHRELLILSSLIAITFLVLGQTIIVETGYLTTVTVWMSLVGGLYMIYLILKENKA
jgi:iron complex transport system permease protein